MNAFDSVETIDAQTRIIAGLPKKDGALHACDGNGRQYYVKTRWCKKYNENPCWIANELIYYVIARRSGLDQMPYAAKLLINGNIYWGSEYIDGRVTMSGTENEGAELLRRACKSSQANFHSLARALLLDIALLNSDRRPWWNILKDANDQLWVFDHEKSLLGDGHEPTDMPKGDLARIATPSCQDDKVGDYLACAQADWLVLGCLTDKELREIFADLALNEDSINAAQKNCPVQWVNMALFSRLRTFLLNWWRYLGEGRISEHPRRYLTHILLKRTPLKYP